MRDICKWHVEEFAYLLGKLKSTPEGDGNMLDRTSLIFVHEHAEANDQQADAWTRIGRVERLGVGAHRHSLVGRRARRRGARHRGRGGGERWVKGRGLGRRRPLGGAQGVQDADEYEEQDEGGDPEID